MREHHVGQRSIAVGWVDRHEMAIYASRPPPHQIITPFLLPLFPLPPLIPGDIVACWLNPLPRLNPKRTVAELKELRALTADENGAQRVAFTETWSRARDWFRERLQALPVEIHSDPAGNVWATLNGKSERSLLIGGHIDSVPNGGWLDGCLNLLAGVEILRRIIKQYDGKPPVTVRLVDWADEEGARFGKSLFGSSACSGNLDLAEARALVDKDGVLLPD